jgi:hypothetical protein
MADAGIQLVSGSLNFGSVGGINNAGNIQLNTGGVTGYIPVCSASNQMVWTNPTSVAVTSLTGTASQILVNGLTTAQTGACTLTLPSSINVTTLPNVNSINTVGNTVTISGATLTSTILNSYLATMNQAVATTSSPTFVNITGTLLTASQPNITTLAGVTSIGTSGNVTILNTLSIGTASPPASA